ncbi:MAG: sensor histidine kinase [Hydrogenophaga sp.]|uniref:sensor histidine kinase n=1 Tax=Hydrogenophaga sp. TaxID=1904254 RepID=UPI00262940DD|nr:sensor histidine kinase [Hydrogenophaga sp.]MDM7942439.1 sensor histidine kinase [Hydrogenophaga sp.]
MLKTPPPRTTGRLRASWTARRAIGLALLLVMAVLGWRPASALQVTGSESGSVRLTEHVSVLEDPRAQWSIDDIRSPTLNRQFKPWSGAGNINLGFSSSAHWVKVTLQGPSRDTVAGVLELPYFLLDTVDFYAPGQTPVHTGSRLPLDSRPFLHSAFAFPVQLEPRPVDVYLRVQSNNGVSVPLYWWPQRAFTHHMQSVLLLQALYFGALVALLIYNLFLFVSLKDRRFLLYTLFMGCGGLGMIAGNGLGQMFLWPGQAGFDTLAQTLFLSMAGGFGLMFGCEFLQAGQHTPRLAQLIRLCAAGFITVALLTLGALWSAAVLNVTAQLVMWIALGSSLLVMFTSVRVVRLGQKGAFMFLLAWCVLWAGVLIAVLRTFELLPTNTFTAYAVQIATAFEMLLLAFALADIVRQERQEREAAQQDALRAQQSLLDASRTAEQTLGRNVQARTEQLERALTTERQLLTQYMLFGALISHEFRNPLGIVDSQISLLRREQELGSLQLEKRLDTMGKATRRLLNLFDKWLQGNQLSQYFQGEKHEAIDLAPWLATLIDVRGTQADTPRLLLLPSSTNERVRADKSLLELAVTNLIDNAFKHAGASSAVVIQTHGKPGWVGISVTDQGCGIDAKHHGAVFNAYYRVEQEHPLPGLGLGLALVRRVVQLHAGHVELTSAAGQGCTFCIWLPDSTPAAPTGELLS